MLASLIELNMLILAAPVISCASSEAPLLANRSIASKDRQIVSLENSSHYDLYDRPETVRTAQEKLGPFFRTHLKDNASA